MLLDDQRRLLGEPAPLVLIFFLSLSASFLAPYLGAPADAAFVSADADVSLAAFNASHNGRMWGCCCAAASAAARVLGVACLDCDRSTIAAQRSMT